MAGLVMDAAGNLYGTTAAGVGPPATLGMDAAGNLYGTTRTYFRTVA